MKRIVCVILVIMTLVLCGNLAALAHPGRTDAQGGHWDRKNGTYHYHTDEPTNPRPAATKKPAAADTAPAQAEDPEDIYEEVWYAETNKRDVNVYEEPSTSASRLTRISRKGTEVAVVDWAEDDEESDVYWYMIWIDGQEGYVHEDYLDFQAYDEGAA